MKAKMNILFFAKFPPPHTGQTIGTEVVADLLSDYAKITRVNTSYGSIKPEIFGKEYIKYLFKFSVQVLKKSLQLRRMLEEEEFDILYIVASPSELGHLRNRLTVWTARSYVRRIVAHVRNGNYHELFERRWTRHSASRLVRQVDTFIFLSEALEERSAPYVAPEKRAVVYNTIDAEVRCTRKEVEAKIRKRANRETLHALYLSNMIPTKGYMDVLRAAKIMLLDRDTSIEVDFIGDWPEGRCREFMQFVERHNLGEVVHVHGRVSDRNVVRQALIDADVFILPTYYPNEAQPRSIIEALNAATPVIATRHAAIPDYVIDDMNGYLVDKQAPDQIAEALVSLADRQRWATLARGARATYEKMFSPDAVRRQMLNGVTCSDRDKEEKE